MYISDFFNWNVITERVTPPLLEKFTVSIEIRALNRTKRKRQINNKMIQFQRDTLLYIVVTFTTKSASS